MEEIQISIIQKVKNELNITEDKSASELYNLLHTYRNSLHPDRFLDEVAKKTAQEKFALVSNLLAELAKLIENERLELPSSDLVLSNKDFEIIQYKQESINYDEQIGKLKTELKYTNILKEDAEKKFLRLQKESVDKKTEALIEHYKPSKGSFIKLTTTFVLTLVISIFTQVEKITTVLSKYSPIGPKALNYFFFSVLCFIPLFYLKKLYEQNKIERIAKKIKTPFFIDKFMAYLNETGSKDTFSELMVFKFIVKEFRPQNALSNYFATNIFDLYSDETIGNLKDIFIYNLTVKQFITFSKTENLDRSFKINNYKQYHLPILLTEDDDDEPAF